MKSLLKDLKSKLISNNLKERFDLNNLFKAFSDIFSGNEYFNSLQVNEMSYMPKLFIQSSLNVTNTGVFDRIKSDIINNTIFEANFDNEIVLNPNAIIKMKNDENFVFKISDIFEVLSFMRYIQKICGKLLSKCDFQNLLTHKNIDLQKITTLYDQKIKNLDFYQNIHKDNNIKIKFTLNNNTVVDKKHHIYERMAERQNNEKDEADELKDFFLNNNFL